MAGSHSSGGGVWATRLLLLIACLLGTIVLQNTHRAYSESSSLSQSPTAASAFRAHPSPLSLLSTPSPPTLPSVRVTQAEVNELRGRTTKYGGKGDKAHLGGFTERDEQGLSYNVFNFMLGPLGIRSVLDLGCGKGFSTMEFRQRGADVLCAEGSHDAVTQSILPPSLVVEHDFTRGPWWPDRTYDALWSVEFFEHVGRPYIPNYLPVLRRSALLFVSSSGFGGWHHVEVHNQNWWRARLQAQGFVFSDYYTDLVHKYAKEGRQAQFDSQHIAHGMQVFINPEVARLPQHHHLFSGWGCHDGTIDNRKGGLRCVGEDALPAQYVPLLDCHLNQSTDDPLIWDCSKTSSGERVVNPSKRWKGK